MVVRLRLLHRLARAMKTVDERPDEVFEQDLPWRRVTGFMARLLLRHPLLLSAMVLAAIGVAGAEVLSLSLIFPFLQSLGGDIQMPDGFALDFMAPFFADMTTEAKVRTIALMLVGIQVVRGSLSYIESRISAYLAIMVERDLRQLVFDDLLRVELRYIHSQQVANLFTIMHTYPKQSAKIARDYLGSLSKAITFTSYIVVLVLLSWKLTLVALVLGGLSLAVVGRLRRVLKRLSRRINRSRVRLHQTTLESLTAMKVIRIFAREDHARRRFLGEVRALQRQSYQNASISAASGPLQRTLNMALFAALLIVATVIMDVSSEGWLVLLSMFLLAMARVMGPLSTFASKRASIAAQLPSLEAVIDFLERKDKPYLKEGTRTFGQLREGVRFDHVTFTYADDRPPVLKEITFDIGKGQMVALVGESGSGKSTLVQLLSRLSDPTGGRILVDGEDLRSFRSGTWRRRVAVVSQDTFLFNDSVRENIRYGRLEATDEEVEAAARSAHAHEFIEEMEEGYDTRVGDRGVRLSGGQAQRIAIARAILANPDVLVLDEATSALDTATERVVQEAIDAVSRERTVVAVAHRLSTVRRADLILVFARGEIVERGTHDELIALQGHYARYVALQDVGEGDGARANAGSDTSEAATPPLTAGGTAAKLRAPPIRRVPVQSPAPVPARVVLTPGSGEARVVLTDGVEQQVPLAVAGEDATHEHVLRKHEGDLVALTRGDRFATVRAAGAVFREVPLFLRGEQGREVRARVANVRRPADGVLRGLIGRA